MPAFDNDHILANLTPGCWCMCEHNSRGRDILDVHIFCTWIHTIASTIVKIQANTTEASNVLSFSTAIPYPLDIQTNTFFIGWLTKMHNNQMQDGDVLGYTRTKCVYRIHLIQHHGLSSRLLPPTDTKLLEKFNRGKSCTPCWHSTQLRKLHGEVTRLQR